MPTDTSSAASVTPKARALDDPRARHILRFVIGVTLATAYGSYVNWTAWFMLLPLVIPLMALPAAPSLRFALWMVAVLIGWLGIGVALMLPLHSHQLFGFALVALIIFVAYYLQAEGKLTGLGTEIVMVCVTLLPTFGQVSMDGGVEFAKGFSKAALAWFPVVWLAFAVLPGGVFPGLPNTPRVAGTSVDRGLLALRPVLLLLPLFIFMLSSDNALRYLPGYYQTAMIAQHASQATGRKLAGDLFMATVIGGTGGVIMWWLLKLWPSWFWFVLVMALFSLVYATRIFIASGGLKPNYYRWSYGLTTLVFIVFPATMSQGFTGDDPDMKFYQRILDYAFVTSYAVVAVLVYDAVVDRLRAWRRRFGRSAA